MNQKSEYKCKHCKHIFTSEIIFRKHSCKEMKRYNFLKTPRGIASFIVYNEWRKLQFRKTIPKNTFLISKYFDSFHRFIEFSNLKSMSNRRAYMTYMISNTIPPYFWCDNDVYMQYIKYLDTTLVIEDWISETSETIKELSNILGCPTSNIFDFLLPIDVIKLITARRVSPWILLLSKKFLDFLVHKTTREEKILFNKIIDPVKWRKNFECIIFNDKASIINEIKLLGIN